jgi:hypothetical protein
MLDDDATTAVVGELLGEPMSVLVTTELLDPIEVGGPHLPQIADCSDSDPRHD